MVIRSATERDARALAAVYNPYVVETVVTFEETPVSEAEMARRVRVVLGASLPWLVAEQGGTIMGYAHASEWKGRCAYRFSVETTVYVAAGAAGRGIGSRLYDALVPILQAGTSHTAIAGIALPNPASVSLHEKFGFQKVAHFKEVGFKGGSWVDVGYWQRML